MSTRLPRLLNANLSEKCRLHPAAMSVLLQLMGVSSAQMSLFEGDAAIAMHDFVEVYTPTKSQGVFRVTNIEDAKKNQITIQLLHAIDTLNDSVWKGQTDYSGTVAGFLAALLAQQSVAYWQLGTCQDNASFKCAGINYDKLSELLERVRSERYGYHFTYDFSTSPWTLNFVANSDSVTSEFRLSRNTENCRITHADGEQCNRLYLSVNQKSTADNVTTTSTEIKTYNNLESQAVWGIIEKTADIDLENVPDADAWANEFLSQRAEPMIQISIDGFAIEQITGETWDEAKLGEVSRVALPEYGEYIGERVVSINYPELNFGDGIERFTVELANHLRKFSETIANTAKQTNRNSRANRYAARRSAEASELKSWSIVVSDHSTIMEDTGLEQLYETGIELDAQQGVRIYSLTQGFVSQYSMIQTNSDEIELRVEKNGVISAINQSAEQIQIQASRINLDGYVTVTKLEATGSARLPNIRAVEIQADELSASSFIYAANRLVIGSNVNGTVTGTMSYQGLGVSWFNNVPIVDSVSATAPALTLIGPHDFEYDAGNGMTATVTGYIVSQFDPGSLSVSTRYMNMLGR